MSNQLQRIGRRPRFAVLLAVCSMAIGLAVPLTAKALPILYDGRFYYTGGDVTIDVVHYDSMYDEVLQLRSALGVVDIANGSQVGTKATLTAKQIADMGIGIGDEMQYAPATTIGTPSDSRIYTGEETATTTTRSSVSRAE